MFPIARRRSVLMRHRCSGLRRVSIACAMGWGFPMARRDDSCRDLLFGLLAATESDGHARPACRRLCRWTLTGGKPMADLLVEQAAFTRPDAACSTLWSPTTCCPMAATPKEPRGTRIGLTPETLAGIDDPDIEATLGLRWVWLD